MKYPGLLLAVLGLILGAAPGARAQTEITLLSPNPIETTINKLVADFQAKSGIKVTITYGTGVSTRRGSGHSTDGTAPGPNLPSRPFAFSLSAFITFSGVIGTSSIRTPTAS